MVQQVNRKLNPVAAAKLDPNRADYGARVGLGKLLNIRASSRLADKFPDGCQVSLDLVGGRVTLTLRNRASGRAWFSESAGMGTLIVAHKDVATQLSRLPEFGTMYPASVKDGPGGSIVLTMPEVLKTKKKYVTGGKTKRTPAKATKDVLAGVPLAVQPSPLQTAEPAAPAAEHPEPAAAAPDQPAGLPAGMDVRSAVEALNAWKAVMGENLIISLRPDGGVTALAQYGS